MIANTVKRLEHLEALKNGQIEKDHSKCANCGRSADRYDLIQVNEAESLCDDCFEK